MQLPINVKDYFNNFDSKKDYGYLIFIAGNPLQSAELNELQDININQFKLMESILFEQGMIISGGNINIHDDKISIGESIIYTDKNLGYLTFIPYTEIQNNQYPVTLGLYVQKLVITSQDDPSIAEPDKESPNYGQDGAYRIKYLSSIVTEQYYNDNKTDNSTFIPIIIINADRIPYYIANEGNLNLNSFLKRLNNLDREFLDLLNKFDDFKNQINKQIGDQLGNLNLDAFYRKSGDDLRGDMRTNGNRLYSDGLNTTYRGFADMWNYSVREGNNYVDTIKVNAKVGSIDLKDTNSYIKVDKIYSFNDLTLGSFCTFNNGLQLLTYNRIYKNNLLNTPSIRLGLNPSENSKLQSYMYYESELNKEVRMVMNVQNINGQYFFRFTHDGRIDAEVFNGTSVRSNYADYAELHISDKQYDEGTLMTVGGIEDVTSSKNTENHIIGVISKNPGMIINNNITDNPKSVKIGLKGKLNIRVVGKVKKGDKLSIYENNPEIAIVNNNTNFPIGISLEDNDISEEKLVMCII